MQYEQHSRVLYKYRDEANGAETGHLLISRESAAVVKAAELETHVETGVAGTTSALGLVAEAPVVGFLGALVGHVLLPQAAASMRITASKATVGAVAAAHAAAFRTAGNQIINFNVSCLANYKRPHRRRTRGRQRS